MSAVELLQWWNLLFALPFVGALMYVLMMVFAGIGAEHDIDHDIDIGHDVDVGHDVDLGHDVDVGHDVDHGGLDHDHHIEPSSLMRFLSVLGVGRVPISIIITSLCFIWGVTGWIANVILGSIFPPGIFIWISLGIAFVCSIMFTRMVAITVSKLMPTATSFGVKHADLVGRVAETDTEVTDRFGQASLREDSGVLMRVSCRVKRGAEPIPRDTQVVLMYYDKASGTYLVNTDLPVELPKE